MTIDKAIEYFENEVRFCERAPAGNIVHCGTDWTRVLDASKTALDALREIKKLREGEKHE
jgi:sugar phosphate isomerase/epimerase